MNRQQPLFLDTKGMTQQELESYGEFLAEQQRDVNWMIGDVARYAKHGLRLGENYSQVFPEWVSPGLIQRCEAVASAYPRIEDRNPDATWTIHMNEAKKHDRIQRVQAHVDAGRTSDEAAKAGREESSNRERWLLAIDVNYHLTRKWSGGEGVEAATNTAQWIKRTVNRLMEKGVTDCVCCLDSTESFRKKLTEGWDKPYKSRATKDQEHAQQLLLVEELLSGMGFCCVKLDGFEADDLLASYAKQFSGKVTLLTVDKDMRQCLSAKCNILPDIVWGKDDFTGNQTAIYPWITAKMHTEEGCTYVNTHIEGIAPEMWPDFQALAGDSGDSIDGAAGIGPKIAKDLLSEFGSVEAAIEAAKEEDERIKPKKREALISFEPKLEVTRQLVTLRNDLTVPMATRINL